MKRNIIIAGVPRAGKTTIASRISKKYGYQHISMDAIIAGFETVFPQLGISTMVEMESVDILYNISNKIAPFISQMIKSDEFDEAEAGMLIDIYQLLPEDYVKHIQNEHTQIFYFLTSNVTPEERFVIQRKHDTKKDYTFYMSDDEIRFNCEFMVHQSKLMKNECIKYNLPYYETAHNREDVFETFLASLEKQHKE